MTLRPADRVKLILPDNLHLDGQLAVVAAITDYGAYVITKVGSGCFRALFSEMVKLEETNGSTRKARKVVPETLYAVEMGYTGDLCETCGCLTMKRVGTCLTCDNCGSTSGCG